MAKRFSFSLQRLLDFKEQLFEIERTILSDMNAVLGRLNGELSALYREHRGKSAEFVTRSAMGMTSPEIMSHKNYLRFIEESIEEKRKQIELQRQAIDRQMDKVREAKIEISSIEKLREKKLEEYNYLDNKAQEQFIEEFVSHTRVAAQGGA